MEEPTTRRTLLRWAGAGGAVIAGGAVSGTAGAQSATEHTLVIEGLDEPTPSNRYILEARNELAASRIQPGGAEDVEEPRETGDGTYRVFGSLGGGRDRYIVTGDLDLVEFMSEWGVSAVRLDGEPIDVSRRLDVHTLLLHRGINPTRGPELDLARYELEVEAELDRSRYINWEANPGDEIDGNVVSGALAETSRDVYTFEGDVVRFGADREIMGVLDGFQFDFREAVETHTLLLGRPTPDRVAPSAFVDYELAVEADLARAGIPKLAVGPPLRNAANDTVDGTVATGRAGSVERLYQRDLYTYTGDLHRLVPREDLRAYLDGARVDLPVRRLTITGTDEPTRYEFEVRADTPAIGADLPAGLRKIGPSATEPTDTVDGATATGVVVGGNDAYEFVGDLVRFTADGDVDVTLDGEPIVPREIVTEHTLTYFQPPGTNQDYAASKYKFEVEPDGSLRADDALGADTDEAVGAVRPNFVRGAVPGSPDSYVFTGEVVWSVAGDSVGIILDGERVTAGELGDV